MTVNDHRQPPLQTRTVAAEAVEPGWWLLIGIAAVVLAVIALNYFF